MTVSPAGISPSTATPLELVELELALKHQNFVELGFADTVREALRRIDGRLLFQMRLDGAADCDWVAAVSVKADGDRVFAIVAQPVEGDVLRVESAEASEIPVAGIVAAYAGLIDQFETVGQTA